MLGLVLATKRLNVFADLRFLRQLCFKCVVCVPVTAGQAQIEHSTVHKVVAEDSALFSFDID